MALPEELVNCAVYSSDAAKPARRDDLTFSSNFIVEIVSIAYSRLVF